MSVLIKGMEMPTNDDMAPTAVWVFPNGYAIVFKDNGNEQQKTQAVPVPPHGRLIDAEALIDAIIAKYIRHERNRELVFAVVEIKQDLVDIINELPTIIEAEEE